MMAVGLQLHIAVKVEAIPWLLQGVCNATNLEIFINMQTAPCDGGAMVNGTSGSFSNPSGNFDYSSGTPCQWQINAPPNVTCIQIIITQFDIGNSEHIRIYHGTTISRTAEIVGFSGQTTICNTTISGLKVLLVSC